MSFPCPFDELNGKPYVAMTKRAFRRHLTVRHGMDYDSSWKDGRAVTRTAVCSSDADSARLDPSPTLRRPPVNLQGW